MCCTPSPTHHAVVEVERTELHKGGNGVGCAKHPRHQAVVSGLAAGEKGLEELRVTDAEEAVGG